MKAARDPDDRARLTDLFTAAARAIHALGEIDLTPYEPTGKEGTDLGAWEEMAPIIGGTIQEVNTLLTTVDERIPLPEEEDDDLDSLDFFGESAETATASEDGGGAGDEEDPGSAAMSAIHGIATVLRMEVGAFGDAMRKPRVMADRWNLLDTLEAFRGKFRAGIGEMVYAAASTLAEVEKEDVVPSYRQDIENSVGLRRALALLAPSVAKENAVAQAASPQDAYTIRRQTSRVMKLIDRFVKSRAGKAMRAADRHSIFNLRSAMEQHIADESSWPNEMQKTLEGLDRFLESMSVINHRETLVIHDRQALPLLDKTLCAARDTAEEGDGTYARLLFSDALETGWRLVGRDPILDDALLRARRVDLSELDAEDIAFWADSMLEKLENVHVP